MNKELWLGALWLTNSAVYVYLNGAKDNEVCAVIIQTYLSDHLQYFVPLQNACTMKEDGT